MIIFKERWGILTSREVDLASLFERKEMRGVVSVTHKQDVHLCKLASPSPPLPLLSPSPLLLLPLLFPLRVSKRVSE
jgi:hypothetical protein